MDLYQLILVANLLVIVKGVVYYESQVKNEKHRNLREIRRGNREERVYFDASEETRDPRNTFIFHNRPAEPLHGQYRKGFSHLHVPDFHRRPLESRGLRGSNQSIDDIVSGIIQLLGGDVHVSRPDVQQSSLAQPSARPTRINNRGPVHFYEHKPPSQHSVVGMQQSSNETLHEIAPTTSKWHFPDDKDVSLILGLLNSTDITKSSSSTVKELINSTVTSQTLSIINGLKNFSAEISSSDSSTFLYDSLVEITPSVTTTFEMSPYSKLMDTVITSQLINNESTPYLDISVNNTTNTPSAEIFVDEPSVTVFTLEQQNTLTETTKQEPIMPTKTSQLIILTSVPATAYISPSKTQQKTFPVPSGPVTEWLPIAKPPEQTYVTHVNRTKTKEPVIITKPTEFEMTVSQQIAHFTNKTEIPLNPTSLSTFQPSKNFANDVSVAIISTHVDVIYGRPTMSLEPPKPPLETPKPPTGRPHVFAVDISQLRTTKRPTIYQRPKPDPGYTYGNKLRPVNPRPAGIPQRRPPPFRPPSAPQVPEVRIDTCVVGDDSTCATELHEQCRTERGVSSCQCRPGFGRAMERGVCSSVVSMLLTLKVAKVGDRAIDPSLLIPGSQDYHRLNLEASHAMSTVFSYSPLAEGFRGSRVNRLYYLANRMVINSTVHLAESEVRGSLRHHLEHAVAAAISKQNNQVGDSQLYISGPLSALLEVEDLNECSDKELNDCSEFAICENLFGTFQCSCIPGYTDKSTGGIKTAGRICSACSPNYCNGRGKCVVINGQQECRCKGNYGGARCQIDNEVVGVSVGVSAIAIIVIAITAACLYLWNRRWKQAQQKSDAAKQAGYRLQTLADHIRWGAANSPLGSNYVPCDSTLRLAPPPITPSANQLYSASAPTYQTANRLQRRPVYEDDVNPYGRIIRTIQKSNNRQAADMQYDTLDSECASSEELGFPSVPSNSFVYHGQFPERAIFR